MPSAISTSRILAQEGGPAPWPIARLVFPGLAACLGALNLGSPRSFDQPSVSEDSGLLPKLAKLTFVLLLLMYVASAAIHAARPRTAGPRRG